MRFIIIIILSLTTFSCSKQRECECITESDMFGAPQNYRETFTVYGTKFDAENTCEGYEYYENGAERNCTLK